MEETLVWEQGKEGRRGGGDKGDGENGEGIGGPGLWLFCGLGLWVPETGPGRMRMRRPAGVLRWDLVFPRVAGRGELKVGSARISR